RLALQIRIEAKVVVIIDLSRPNLPSEMVIERGRPDMTLRFTMDNENSGNPFVCFQQLATYFQSRPAICDSPRGNPKGCKKVAGGRSPRRPPEKSLVMTAPRRGARHWVQTDNIVYRINRAHGLHSGGKEEGADAVEGNQCDESKDTICSVC